MEVILSGSFKFADLMAILGLFDEGLRFDNSLMNLVRISNQTHDNWESDLSVECCYYWLLQKYMDIPTILAPEQLASKNAPILCNFINNYMHIFIFRTTKLTKKFRIEYKKIINFSIRLTGYCELVNIDYNDPAIHKEDYVWYG